jgi:hypothetical protein
VRVEKLVLAPDDDRRPGCCCQHELHVPDFVETGAPDNAELASATPR